MAPLVTIVTVLVLARFGTCINPCTGYKSLNEATRSVGYEPTANEQLNCDRVIPADWYRFTANTGGEMPSTCVPEYHCGTHVGFWLKDPHPSQTHVAVDATACGKYMGNCCHESVHVKVMNCGTYYVYYLVPLPSCSMTYCAGTKLPCGPEEFSATGFPPCQRAFPAVTHNPTISKPIVSPTKDTFKFDCNIDYDHGQTNVGFKVEWLFNGVVDHTIPPSMLTGLERTASLDQKYLAGHMGTAISCSAKAYNLNTPHRLGPAFETTNHYWMGIKLSTPKIEITEKDQPKAVKLISTVPIVCPIAQARGCKVDLYLEPNNHDVKFTKQCTQTLLPSSWNPVTHTAETTFQVIASRDFIKDKDKLLEVHFQQISSHQVDAPDIFKNYTVPFLQVQTKDKDTSVCKCTGDPHCYTLDSMVAGGNKGHYNYYSVGEYTMYKSTNPNRNFEVQVRTWPCWKVTCNCAVSAREGNDVVTIDMCHSKWGSTYPKLTVVNKSQLTQGTVIQRDDTGKQFLISFPSGAWVKVDANPNYMNVYVQAPSDDNGATQGLCGTFDGNPDNDLTHKDGTVDTFSSEPQSFVDSWRIPIGTSFFDKPPAFDPKLNNNLYYCNCGAKGVVNCTTSKGDVAAISARCVGCKVFNGNRAVGHQVIGEDTDEPAPIRFKHTSVAPVVVPNWPTASGITESKARQICTDTMMKDSTVKKCVTNAGLDIEHIVDICMEDIKISDDISFAQDAIGIVIMDCLDKVLTDPASYDNSTGLPPAFITTDICPNQCTGNGVCHRGTCTCNHGFVGFDCSINTLIPASINDIIGGEFCDVQKRPCHTIFVMGGNMRDSSSFQCRLKESKFVNGAFTSTGKTYDVQDTHMSLYHVGCHMPVLPAKTVVAYTISVTNDRHLYSTDSKTVSIIDSQCMSCDSHTKHCTVKASTCLIDGKCRSAQEHSTTESNLICDPTATQYHWTSLDKPLGGQAQIKFDIWTKNQTGCKCYFDASRVDCACCEEDACQCPDGHHNQCVQCGTDHPCGTPLPAPDNGMDGFTLAFNECKCIHGDTSLHNCACCQNGGCQCGPHQKNQCVSCDRLELCGGKPWLFGPNYP